MLFEYYGSTDIEEIELDLKKIRLPKLIYMRVNHWLFEKGCRSLFRKNGSKINVEVANIKYNSHQNIYFTENNIFNRDIFNLILENVPVEILTVQKFCQILLRCSDRCEMIILHEILQDVPG